MPSESNDTKQTCRHRLSLYVAGLLMVFAALCLPHPARADIAPPDYPPGASLSPGSEGTRVRMAAETVTLEVQRRSTSAAPAQARVQAVFTMRNMGDVEEQMEVRFPLTFWNGSSDGFFKYPEIQNFQARVNGRQVPTRRVELPGTDMHAGQDVPWAVFDAAFPPGEDVEIEVNYLGDAQGEYPYAAYSYILETGAGWYDTIGSADLIVRYPYEISEMVIVRDHAGFAEGIPGGELRGREIRWHYTDLEPTSADNFAAVLVLPEAWEKALVEQDRVEKNPRDGEAWGRLGKAYKEMLAFRRGMRSDPGGQELYRLSVQAYEQALELKPEDALWHFGFADLLWDHFYWLEYSNLYEREVDYTELVRAVQELQRSLELMPDNSRALELAQEIAWGVEGAVVIDEEGNIDFPILAATPTARPTDIIPILPTETPGQETLGPTNTAAASVTETAAPEPDDHPTQTPPAAGQDAGTANSVGAPATAVAAVPPVENGSSGQAEDQGSQASQPAGFPLCFTVGLLPLAAAVGLRKRSS